MTDDGTFRDLGCDPAAARRLWGAFLEGRPGVTWARVWALVVLREWAARHLLGVRHEAAV